MTEPPTRAVLWRDWARWVIGVPAVVLGALAIIGGALWMTQGEMMWRAMADMGTALFYIGGIILIWPFAAVFLTLDLRDKLRARAAWEAMSPEQRAAALPPVKRRRRAPA